MEIIFANGVRFSIEFIKILIIITCFFKYKPKRKINILFLLTLLCIMLSSFWINISEISIIYGIVSIAVICFCVCEKHILKITILSYIGISIIDMIFANIIFALFYIDLDTVQDNSMIGIVLNSITLVAIIAITLIRNKKMKLQKIPLDLFPILILGGIALSVYLTAIQFMGLGETYPIYRYGIIIGLCFVAVAFVIICIILIKNKNENEYLKLENEMNHLLLKSQNDYYTMILQKENETKEFRHDIKEHIMCMQLLYEKKRYSELGKYIIEMEDVVKDLSPKVSTGNAYVDAIVSDLLNQYKDVNIEWNGKIPQLKMSHMDVCTLFYNLLKNSFEAADEYIKKDIKVICKIQEVNVIIIISNYFLCIHQGKDNELISTKRGENHGYGIRNIRKCVDKNHGNYSTNIQNDIFCTKIILTDVIR